MKKKLLIWSVGLLMPGMALAGAEDDPVISKLLIDQFEIREADGPDPVVLDAQAWIGRDLHKLWFKTEMERVDGDTEEAELQLLYSRAIAPYWDLQVGWRRDLRPQPERNWAALGLEGLAPYFFEVDAALFIGESGQTAARVEAEYEFMLTQRWVLSPEVEINAYGKGDPELGVGSGVSDLEAGLRLRYEIRREFAPYIGVNWVKKFSRTADFARDEGEETSDIQFVAGIRAWF